MEWDGKDGPIQLFLTQPSASLMIVELESGENQAILDFLGTLSPSCAIVLCVRLFEKGCNPGSIISCFKAQAGVCGPKVNWVHQQSKPDFPVSLESIAHLNALSCQMLLSVGWYFSPPRFEENCGSAKATCSWFSWDENPRLTKDFRPSGFRDVKQLAPGHLENLGFIFP